MTDGVDAAQQLAGLRDELSHARRVIAWLLTGHRGADGAVPHVEIPYRTLDEMGETSVLVRRHRSNNDVVEYGLFERAEVLEL